MSAGADTMIRPGSNQLHLELYHLMTMSRALDEIIGSHDGHWHGLEGEEAVVAGVYHGLRPTDVLAPHYRGTIIAAYAKGADLRTLLAGAMGRTTGYNMGRYRNDICGPAQYNLIGLYSGSLGPPLGYATGGALAAKMDGRDDVAVAVFGDGSSSRGDCHESMNLASVKKLPVVFVCQNNQIAISTEAQSGVGGSVAERGRSFGMPGIAVDGNDVLAVHAAMQEAIGRARAGEGPSTIEAVTYRVAGHFYSDAEDYRDPQTVRRWRERDPIRAYRDHLIAEGIVDASGLDAMDAEARQKARDAMDTALADPLPTASDLAPELVYAPDGFVKGEWQ
jgi:TPP-dependent pyruvate/acetoin dehydrogenase alpha subunit